MWFAESGQCAGHRPQGRVSDMRPTRFFGLLAAVAITTSPAAAQTDLKFALDWKFEGPAAPYFVAIYKGYYKAEGLNVTIDSGPGSVQGIGRDVEAFSLVVALVDGDEVRCRRA